MEDKKTVLGEKVLYGLVLKEISWRLERATTNHRG